MGPIKILETVISKPGIGNRRRNECGHGAFERTANAWKQAPQFPQGGIFCSFCIVFCVGNNRHPPSAAGEAAQGTGLATRDGETANLAINYGKRWQIDSGKLHRCRWLETSGKQTENFYCQIQLVREEVKQVFEIYL